MREEWVTLSRKEQDVVRVLDLVEHGGVVVGQAAVLMELSVLLVTRLLSGCRREGAAALVHGDQGRENQGRRSVQLIG